MAATLAQSTADAATPTRKLSETNTSAKWAALFPHESPLMREARRDLVDVGFDEELVEAMSFAEVKRFAF